MFTGFSRNSKIGNCLGFLSILLAIVPVLYIFHADTFPNYTLTETVVLIGGVGGTVLAAFGVGFVGSRLWLIAIFAGPVEVIALWGFGGSFVSQSGFTLSRLPDLLCLASTCG